MQYDILLCYCQWVKMKTDYSADKTENMVTAKSDFRAEKSGLSGSYLSVKEGKLTPSAGRGKRSSQTELIERNDHRCTEAAATDGDDLGDSSVSSGQGRHFKYGLWGERPSSLPSHSLPSLFFPPSPSPSPPFPSPLLPSP